MIERAAVQGEILYEAAVADLAQGAQGAGITDSLGSLVRKELIRPDSSEPRRARYLDRRGDPSAEASERALGFAQSAGERFEEREIVEGLAIASSSVTALTLGGYLHTLAL